MNKVFAQSLLVGIIAGVALKAPRYYAVYRAIKKEGQQ